MIIIRQFPSLSTLRSPRKEYIMSESPVVNEVKETPMLTESDDDPVLMQVIIEKDLKQEYNKVCIDNERSMSAQTRLLIRNFIDEANSCS